MRVLLTGGYGCIGCWIAKNLIERGLPVWVFDLKEDLRRMRQVMDDDLVRQVQFCQGDVTDLPGFRSTLERHGITHVIHLAGLQVPICRADPILGAKVNVVGTLCVFEAVRQLGQQIQSLVYASSAAVFGTPADYEAGTSIPDHAPLRPTTHYGVFKACNEGNARIYFQDHGLSSIGLRPWTVYGVGRDFGMTSEPTKAIKCVALGRPYRISYGGVQDLQYADDVARTFLRCLEGPSPQPTPPTSPDRKGGARDFKSQTPPLRSGLVEGQGSVTGAFVYNLRGAVVDLPHFLRTLCEVAPEARDLITHGDRQLAIAYDLADDALARDLGPIPKTPLREGIRQTLDRFRELLRAGRLDVSDLT